MHRQVVLWLRRSRCALFLAALLVTTAAAQRELGATAAAGLRKSVWRSSSDPTRTMSFAPTKTGSVALESRGLFEAVAFPTDDGTGLIGISRSPHGPSVQPGVARRYEVLHVVRVDSTTLRVSFSSSVGEPGSRSEVWTLEPEREMRPPPSPVAPDAGSPKFGDYVYVEELPEAIHRVPPDYPAWARERGLHGTAMLQVLVGKDGLVKDVRVVKSVPELDDFAIEAARKWRFKPAEAKGSPVEVWVGIPIKFPPG